MRILITASRDWEDDSRIARDLTAVAAMHRSGEILTIMHGDCPTGGDRMARNWCENLARHYDNCGIAIQEERYPAKWDTLGKSAGFTRNAEMVAHRPDICFAYIKPCVSPRCRRLEVHGSHGATHCSALAKASGIRVVYRRRGYVVSR